MSFYSSGEEADEKPQKVDTKFTPRFYIPVGEEYRVTILDDHVQTLVASKDGPKDEDGEPRKFKLKAPLFFDEHNPVTRDREGNKRYKNFTTCRRKSGDCPLCDANDEPRAMVALTVIDHHKWTDKEKKTHRDTRTLLIMSKASTMYAQLYRIIVKLRESGKPLRGMSFLITREGPRNPPGHGTAIVRDVDGDPFDLDKLPAEDRVPFCYPEVLAPQKPEDIIRRFKIQKGVIGASKNVGRDDDDDERPTNKRSRDDDDERPTSKRRRDDDGGPDPDTKRKSVSDLDDDDDIPF